MLWKEAFIEMVRQSLTWVVLTKVEAAQADIKQDYNLIQKENSLKMSKIRV